MSSVGQAVGGALGAVGGFFLGGFTGAMYGAQLGMMAGGYLDPPKGPNVEGPRLDDLTVQTATYGAVIPRVYGTVAVTGNVFWLENNHLKETVTTTSQSAGGKGGGSKSTTTTYSYSATFAVGLCDCPAAPIVGIKRLWIAGRLFYDAGSNDVGAIIASNAAAEYFTLHTGAADQAPDERMQATLGVANTPAYRGLAYLVFRDLPLADYSNSLLGAQVKAEVVSSGGAVLYSDVLTMPVSKTRLVAGSRDIIVQIDKYSSYFEWSVDGTTWTADALPVSKTWDAFVYTDAFGFVAVAHDGTFLQSRDGLNWTVSTVGALTAATWTSIAASADRLVIVSSTTKSVMYDGDAWTLADLPSSGVWRVGYGAGQFVAVVPNTRYGAVSSDGITWAAIDLLISANWSAVAWDGTYLCVSSRASSAFARSTDGLTWQTSPTPHASINWNLIGSSENGEFVCVSNAIDGYARLARSTDHGASWSVLNIFAENWSALVVRHNYLVASCPGVRTLVARFPLDDNTVTLASIVSAEVAQSRLLTAADIDVSALTQPVRGYRIASVAALRAAIDPLRGAWPFDVVQHGYKVLFKPRGSASVATIPAADLDARASGDAPGVSITAVREMDSQLPRRVRVQFMDVDREYDTNEQSDERQHTASVNVTSLDLAVVLSCAEAAGIAQVLLYLYWLERWDVSFALPPAYAALEPGDVVTIAADEATYSLRLTAITYAADGRLECRAKYHRSATYTPTAVAVAGPVTPQTLSTPGPTRLELLDIPLLTDSSDKPGFVAALTGYLSGWTGGVLYSSSDAGQTWAMLQAVAAPGATVGTASNAIGAGRIDLVDTASALAVTLTRGELSSVTESALLNGANHFAYGAAGRWEIIGAKTCTLQGDGSYILTDLLRGRQGSEWARGLHAAGDVLVLLDADEVEFVSVSLDTIGAARTYRAATAGQDLAAVSDVAFTYSGVNLECLAPVYLNGNRHPTTNDWTLTWTRRTRVGGAWRDYVDATLGEVSEAYDVELYTSAAYTTLKRTLSGLTSASATYTSAQQVADFGVNQPELYVKVYQLSAAVGRGYPLTATITR